MFVVRRLRDGIGQSTMGGRASQRRRAPSPLTAAPEALLRPTEVDSELKAVAGLFIAAFHGVVPRQERHCSPAVALVRLTSVNVFEGFRR
jgi:hypothetical protein